MGPHLNSNSDADPNCVEPACKSKVDLFRQFVGSEKKEKREASSLTPQESEQRKIECPLDREELGRSTWGLVSRLRELRYGDD